MNSRELLKTLKKEAKDFSILNLMNARIFLEKDMKYLPKDYLNEYLTKEMEYFTKILKKIKSVDINEIDNYPIDENKLKKLYDRIDKLKKEDSKECESFIKLSKIVLPYLIFIEKKPIHSPNIKFPGGKTIKKVHNSSETYYYCPVKNKQKNEYSLCEFCICKSLED